MILSEKRHNRICLLTLVFFIGLVSEGIAQQWSIALRPAINFPTETVSDTDLRIGNGLEFTAQYQIMPHLQLFSGLTWHQFDTDEDFEASNTDYALRGFVLGSRVYLPINKSKLDYYVVVAAFLHRLDLESKDPDIKVKTSFQPDFTFGAGIVIPTFTHLKIVPEIRYVTFSDSVNTTQIDQAISLRFVSLSVGIRYEFL